MAWNQPGGRLVAAPFKAAAGAEVLATASGASVTTGSCTVTHMLMEPKSCGFQYLSLRNAAAQHLHYIIWRWTNACSTMTERVCQSQRLESARRYMLP